MNIHRLRMTLALGLALSAAAAVSRAQQEPPAPLVRLDEILRTHPIKEGETQTSVELMRGDGVSAHLIQVRTRIRPQYHKDHSETVYLLEGGGIFILGDRAYPVKQGSLLMIPRGITASRRSSPLRCWRSST